MSQPVVLSESRKLGYKFMAAEAWWIITGQNRVDTISPYAKMISEFSDDGIYYSGAYGPKVVDQLSYIIASIEQDTHCRQAVINIWRENPRPSRDIPCTLSLEFLCRDNRLSCVATMRSSDAWLGWVYDVFNFSMISAYLVQVLKERNTRFEDLELGDLILTAGSQHLYERDLENVRKVLGLFHEGKGNDPNDDLLPATPRVEETSDIVQYLSFMKDYDPRVVQGGNGFLDDLFKRVYNKMYERGAE